MTTAFARRFQSLVDHMANGSKKHFAQLTGKSPSTIYRICRGASRPSTAYLEQLYDAFRIDLNWLLTGEHSPGQETTPGHQELVFAPQFDVEASAGSGCITFNEEVSESFAFNKSWLTSQLGVHSEQVAFVTVKGDSMNPTLEDGDMILVDLSQHQLVREGIYLLQTEDGLHTKRLKTHKNGIQVISDNPEYPSWQITPTDAQPSRIAGKVVWCARGI
ncbi:XRE family transcriptional regulator [Vibrio quintilis]|uniref:Putative HTH-type transcriptional regulator n=1 Tax=Vibrio quintilis TaxID=1117707 RepID=A0A1M7YWW6_9VIBR|nr:helix-turn-helix transcriptional regulator [Vibrio quintilis]SHO57088.1 putative HTH-type transcriptional regulator [Vibrio quintilis]